MIATAERGHRVRGHMADEMIEAWGPNRETCLEQAVLGLVGIFADSRGVGWGRHVAVPLTGTDEQVLVDLLEVVVYHLDVDDAVPVRVRVEPHGDGVVAHLWMTDRRRVRAVGAAPKGVARSGLRFGPGADGAWRCLVTIDL